MRPLILALVVVALLVPAAARANGDPASDILLTGRVFLSIEVPTQSSVGQELLALAEAAKEKKRPIRVAVIASSSDLGLVPGLFRKPQQYAEFLWKELQLAYHGTLVVVMPNGYGVYGPGATTAAQRALSRLAAPATSNVDKLGEQAAAAMRAVAAANGYSLPIPHSSKGGSGKTIGIAAAISAGLLALGALLFLLLRHWLLR
jgi:transglutaminase-like putative cysteine protease